MNAKGLGDYKFIFGALIASLVLIAGFAVFVSVQSKGTTTATLSSAPAQGFSVTPENIDLGEVPINGGIITKEYVVTNASGEDRELVKIATSCMCTTASVTIGDDQTRFFGMEMHGDSNPPLNLELKSGQSAQVSVRFDPAAHGPEGVGPFDRIVWLYFDNGMKEIAFSGEVIK